MTIDEKRKRIDSLLVVRSAFALIDGISIDTEPTEALIADLDDVIDRLGPNPPECFWSACTKPQQELIWACGIVNLVEVIIERLRKEIEAELNAGGGQ